MAAEALLLRIARAIPHGAELPQDEYPAAIHALRADRDALRARVAALEADDVRRRDMFWPTADEAEGHLYEVRNGRNKDYVLAHATALTDAADARGYQRGREEVLTKWHEWRTSLSSHGFSHADGVRFLQMVEALAHGEQETR